MADITNKQKKELAKMLYTQNELTQEEIAQRVGTTRTTIGRWVKEGKWELLRTSLMMSREAQLSALYDSLGELNKKRLARPEGERIYTQQEADSIAKISKSIERMQTERAAASRAELTSLQEELEELATRRDRAVKRAEDAKRFIERLNDPKIAEIYGQTLDIRDALLAATDANAKTAREIEAIEARKKASEAGADSRTPSVPQYFSWINNTNEGSTEAQTLTNLDFFAWLRRELICTTCSLSSASSGVRSVTLV